MQITITVDNPSPQDFEALAAFVAVKRGLLTSAGRVDVTGDSSPPAAALPEPVAAAVAKADGIASTISAMVDDMTAKANEKAAADHAEWLARNPAPAAPAGVDVDKDGIPWDARIHAESKAKNADGSWRAKRKVDPAFVASVTAELRAVMAVPAPAVDQLSAEAAAAFGSPAIPLPPTTAVVPPPPPPVPPVAPVAESLPAASPSAAGAETVAEAVPTDPPFVVMMRGVTARQQAGSLSADAVAAALANLGLPSIASLASRPDLIPSFEALLAA